MGKGRLEAFSDGVIAIIITIMVLELKVPHAADWDSMKPLLPIFLCYILSFIYVGIYWNNHHHLIHAVEKVNGQILWANLHLLFWLSLIPFVTSWMGENHFAALPVSLYGFVLLMCGFAFEVLVNRLLVHHDQKSLLVQVLKKDYKGWLSVAIYLIAIVLSFYNSYLACGIYVLVAIMWFLPYRSIEKSLARGSEDQR